MRMDVKVSNEMERRSNVGTVAAFLTGAGLAAAVVVVLKKRAATPERQVANVINSCEGARRALESRLKQVDIALAG